MAKTRQSFSKIIGAISLVLLSLLAIRVIDLQGFQGDYFHLVSEENRQFRGNLPAERGVFFDRYGDPLVMNTRSYFRYLNPLAAYSATEPIAHPEALLLQATEPFAVGYQLQRQYSQPLAMAHVLGYTSVVTTDDLANDTTLGLTDQVGRIGLERQYDDSLRGKDGYQEFEINALGEKQFAQFVQEPTAGQSVQTTLDPYLSAVAWQAMGEKTGAVVILDAETGAVLSLVSTPAFDSNLFTPDPTADDQQRLAALQQALADERKLFFNRAISGLYAPGSTFKLITAVAGLDNDAFAVDTTVDDQGVLEVGEQSFANWYYTQYGRTEGLISVVRAISRSNDIFFYRAAEWTGVEALAQKARDFGFGERTGVELPGEQAGLVPDPAWKEETFGERWFLGNTFHLGIGQGDLLSTPLQLAQMMTVFGNNGTMCHPRVVASDSRTQAAANCGGVGVDEETLAVVQEGMIGACSGGGTAFPFFAWNDTRLANLSEDLSPANQIREGVVACKTGTAEFGGADERGFRRTHALFGMTVGGLHDLLVLDNPELETELAQDEASAAATVSDSATEQAADLTELRQQWFAAASRENFPDAIVILVLVESDEEQPYAEGSREAAPVARDVFGWLVGENQ